METMITGYQFHPETGAFMGAYQFPKNLDKEEVHVPPITTLVAPPAAPAGQRAFWRSNRWVVAPEPVVVLPLPGAPE